MAFGSVLAMGLPIGVAVVGVGTGIGLTALLSNVDPMPEFATTIGAMIGLGVGIDYALFIVTRYREAIANGRPPEQALLVAMDTAGRAVVFAGLTVVVSLLGLLIIGLSFVTGLGIAASVTVLSTMVASVTLLPALHRLRRQPPRGDPLAGADRVGLRRRRPWSASASAFPSWRSAFPSPWSSCWPASSCRQLRASAEARPDRSRSARRWATDSAGSCSADRGPRRSWPAACSSCWPSRCLGLRMGFSDEGNFDESTDARQAYDLVPRPSGRASTARSS